MRTWFRRIGYGVLLWAIPYAISIPLLPLQASDVAAFKGIMAFVGSVTAAILAVLYFKHIKNEYIRESIYVAAVWVILNWLLDFATVLPFTHQTLTQYFLQIGIEYVGGGAFILAIGYLLEKKSRAITPQQ